MYVVAPWTVLPSILCKEYKRTQLLIEVFDCQNHSTQSTSSFLAIIQRSVSLLKNGDFPSKFEPTVRQGTKGLK